MARIPVTRGNLSTLSIAACLSESKKLAGILERGQATCPLSDLLAEVKRACDTPHLTLALVGISRENREHLVRWICEAALHIINIRPLTGPALIEIHLDDHVYAIEQRGDRYLFDSAEDLASRVRELDFLKAGDGESWASALRVQLPAENGPGFKTVLVPDNFFECASSVSSLRALVCDADLAIVAAAPDFEPTDLEAEMLRELSCLTPAIWPIVILFEPSSRYSGGWWSRKDIFRSQRRLPTRMLQTNSRNTLPAFLARSDDSLYLSMIRYREARLASSGVELLASRHRTRASELSAQSFLLRRKIRAVDEKQALNEIRNVIDRAQGMFEREVSDLALGVAELNRKSMLPAGTITKLIDEAIKTIEVGDFQEHVSERHVALTLSERYLRRQKMTLERALIDQLKTDLVYVRDGLAMISSKLAAHTEGCGMNAVLSLPQPDFGSIAGVLKDTLVLDPSYRAELPKRGVMQRLSEGRRIVFMLLMTASIVGSAFIPNIRQELAFILLPLFLAAIAQTYYSWRREHSDRMAKETARVKDLMGREIKRLIVEAQREKASRIDLHLTSLKKDVAKVLETAAKEASKRLQDSAELEKGELKLRLASIDSSMKDVQALQSRIMELQAHSAESLEAARIDLENSIRSAQLNGL